MILETIPEIRTVCRFPNYSFLLFPFSLLLFSFLSLPFSLSFFSFVSRKKYQREGRIKRRKKGANKRWWRKSTGEIMRETETGRTETKVEIRERDEEEKEMVVSGGFFPSVRRGTEQHVARCVLGIPTLTRLITAIRVAMPRPYGKKREKLE